MAEPRDTLCISSHPSFGKTGDEILAELAKLVEELRPMSPRVTGIYVHAQMDVEYLTKEFGDLLAGVRLETNAYLPADLGLVVFSDGSSRVFRIRADKEPSHG